MKKEKKIMTGLELEPVTLKKGYKQTKLGVIPEDWKVNLIGDIYIFKNGLNKEKKYFGFGTPIINYMDVNKLPFVNKNNIKGKVSLNESEKKRFNILKGDVFFTRTSETINEIALSTVLTEDIDGGVFSGFVLRARPINDKIDIEYAKYCFLTQIVRNEIKSKSSFTTRALTNGRFLSEVNILIPPKPQQIKIAKILSTWDAAINKQTQLIQAKQQQKKALMQLLLTGKKRFDGFTEVWKEVRLGEVAIKNSSSLSANSLSNNKGDFKVYGAIGFLKRIDFYNEEDKYISIVKDGAGVGRTLLCDAKSSVLGTLDVIKPKENIDLYFLYLVLKMINFLKYIIGSTIPHIYFKDYSTYKIKLPTLKEQKKIAQVLSKSDQEITLLKEQLAQFQQQKQGLMQVLLTGKVLVSV